MQRKTTLLAYLFGLFTRTNCFCALVDTDYEFNCIRADAAGITLNKVLWILCTQAKYQGDKALSLRNVHNNGEVSNTSCRHDAQISNWKQIQRKRLRSSVRRTQLGRAALLDRTLRAVDILLHNGGFAVIAVDISGISEAMLHRVPLTTWFRFARVADKTQTALIFLTCAPIPYSTVWGVSLQTSRG